MRSAGTVHMRPARSISFQLAPRTSPDREAVRMVNSRARALKPAWLRNAVMKAPTFVKGRAL